MPNKIIKTDKGVVSVRIDGVYTTNEKHLLSPYIKEDGTEKYFGSLRFSNVQEAKKTLKEAVKMVEGAEDTIFDGQYPKWEEDDQFGTSLKVNNRFKFYQGFETSETVPDLNVRDYVYAVEIHLSKNKENGIYMRVARAIAIGTTDRYIDDLFEDEFNPF